MMEVELDSGGTAGSRAGHVGAAGFGGRGVLGDTITIMKRRMEACRSMVNRPNSKVVNNECLFRNCHVRHLRGAGRQKWIGMMEVDQRVVAVLVVDADGSLVRRSRNGRGIDTETRMRAGSGHRCSRLLHNRDMESEWEVLRREETSLTILMDDRMMLLPQKTKSFDRAV
ncbi:hypothetical protein FS842_000588 [Serendipita sp. 407]|nr:hypothetical protein FS842_000588 [Serendipita sp. 407]